MGKKYLDTKRGTLESSVLGVWKEQNDFQETVMDVWEVAAEQGIFEKNLDPVGQADDDIDNDGDVDSSDKYLHKRLKAISKAMKKEGVTISSPSTGKVLYTSDPKQKKIRRISIKKNLG